MSAWYHCCSPLVSRHRWLVCTHINVELVGSVHVHAKLGNTMLALLIYFIMTGQSKHWCRTLNNWNVKEESRIRALEGSVEYLVCRYEGTKEGATTNLQFYVVFKN